MRPHCHLLRSLAAALGVALVLGCSPAIERPLSGAQPGQGPTPGSNVPPTLSPADLHFADLPSPSPGSGRGASTAPSPSPVVPPGPPVIRSLLPAPDSLLPPDAPVTLYAAVEGRGADLANVSLTLDGVPARAVLEQRDPRSWTIAARQDVPEGEHVLHVLVADVAGRTTNYAWKFTVASPTPTPEPTEPPTPTPQVTPTRAPVPPTATRPAPPATPKPQATPKP